MALVLEDQSMRDGLQFEPAVLRTDDKLELVRLLVAAGFRQVQIGSFVHPKVVPQMADTEEVIRGAQAIAPDATLSALVLNDRGLDRALACGLRHLSMSSSASDSHSRRNVNRPADEAFEALLVLARRAVDAGVQVRPGIQCAFGCVYEGPVPEARVVDMAARLAETGAAEVCLADTTGMANPRQVQHLVAAAQNAVAPLPISLHLHDTRGLGLVNVLAAYDAGVQVFDVSAGGLGGCPFVKGASGNVAGEDVVNLFEQIGVPTGIDLPALCRVVERYEQLLGRRLPGRLTCVLQARRAAEA
jgi:hydroxymethylglutaryl-CoA lyase